MAGYDIIIRGGTIIDGTGDARRNADVGIRNGDIEAVGDLNGQEAWRIIDAAEKYIAPGFIDITNHSDTHLSLFTYPGQESALLQGVTTIIGGNCGASLAPLASSEAIKGIAKWADPSDININWTTFEEFLRQLGSIGLGVNFGSFTGYGTLRRGVMTDQIRPATVQERQEIAFLLESAVDQGSFGLSLGLSYGHERVSTTEEIIDIARALKPSDSLVKLHLRSEGKDLLAAVNEAVRIGREAGVRVQISHFKAIGKKAWPREHQAREIIRRAKESGLDIDFDVSPYATTGSPLYTLIPAWARAGGFAELFRRIDDFGERQKIIEELLSYTLHYEKILVTSAFIKTIVGKSLAEVARQASLPPEEALLQTIRANRGRVSIVGRTVSRKNMIRSIQDIHAMIASDGAGYAKEVELKGDLAHPRSFGAFPHFWHRFVGESALLTPEEAIRKSTSRPARKLGIEKRGEIKKGYWADLIVFDPRLFRDRATYKNPFRYAEGLNAVIVNGVLAAENGAVTEARAGKVLRKA